MANIDQYLEEIANARYGKEVRDAIYNAINELNNMIVSGDTLSSNDPAINQVLSTINNRETPVREGRELLGSIEDDLIAIMNARYGRDVRQSIHDAIYDINEVAQGARNSATASAEEAEGYAQSADQSASNAQTNATLSRSYAVGGTGTRTGEDTDNAKYYAESIHPGVANGVATLDATGRVPSAQLPSYVDDVLEYESTSAFPATGESGKIYIALDTNKTYRWGGSAYAEISESLALGETTGTAYEGSKGKANADAIGVLQTTVGGLSEVEANPSGSATGTLNTLRIDNTVYNVVGSGGGGVNPAPTFDITVAYKVGDYVTYNGDTYRFKDDKSAGAWDSTKVEQEYSMGARVTAGKKANTTLGNQATAEGYRTTASGFASHAEGYLTTASGFYSHAEGQNTTASDNFSHAEGCSANAQHLYSHAEGYDTQTGADYQHVQGKYNVGKSTTLFEIGNGTAVNARANVFEVDTSGNVVASGTITDGQGHVLVNSAPLFDETIAYGTGDYVIYEGNTYRFTSAKTAGVAWDSGRVNQEYSMGARVIAGKKSGTTLGLCATAEGNGTTASGHYSHAEGENTTASGDYSHAEGRRTTASGDYSHAEGYYTKTGADYQHIQGKWNIGKSTTLFEIGNGTADNARSNAFEVDTSGNVVASGTYTDGNGNRMSTCNQLTDAVETTDTAQYLHTVGSYFINKNSKYCRTTVQINVGSTIVIGTNCVETNISSEFTNTTTVGSVWQSPNIKARFYKYGRIVFVSLESAKADKNYAINDTMDDIPDAYRPIESASMLDTIPPSNTPIKRITFAGGSSSGSGHIYALASFAQSENIRGFITYISAE